MTPYRRHRHAGKFWPNLQEASYINTQIHLPILHTLHHFNEQKDKNPNLPGWSQMEPGFPAAWPHLSYNRTSPLSTMPHLEVADTQSNIKPEDVI
jgi:hypothetical protein